MHVRFSPTAPSAPHIFAIPVSSGQIAADKLAQASGLSAGTIGRAVAAARFEGEPGSIVELFGEADGVAVHVLLVGIGSGSEGEGARLEKSGGALTARLLTSGATTLAIDARDLSPAAAAHIALGATLRSWRYDTYRTKLSPKQKPSLSEIALVGAKDGAEAAWERFRPVAEGVFLTRELVTEPANIIYPESFVDRVRPLADYGVRIEILDQAPMEKLGMGALLGVSQGSPRPPRVLALHWDGTDGRQKEPLALVGKGVTFDTGGISIKPAAGMEDMKWDMGGAAAVAGVMKSLALRKAKAHVIGVCGLVENMPDGNAQRPGDVVTTMSGQTVEVINTDAEGRLVLCDVLTWVQRTYKPKTIVDLATLTGAMIITLGHEKGGLFANDDSLADQLMAASAASGDALWRLPLGDAYDKLIDSPIADIKNVGPREGGSITAAQFIKRFIDDGVRWAHLDIAGMVWTAKPGSLWDKGATGFGVRLLDQFVADNFEK
jgi:leucyl aminopeptidase